MNSATSIGMRHQDLSLMCSDTVFKGLTQHSTDCTAVVLHDCTIKIFYRLVIGTVAVIVTVLLSMRSSGSVCD